MGLLFVNTSVEGQCVKIVAEVPFANTINGVVGAVRAAERRYANTINIVLCAESVVEVPFANTINSAISAEKVSGRNGTRRIIFVKAKGVRHTRA